MNPILCPDSIPSFLKLFDLSIAPHLLFYTYVPTIFISLALGIYIYFKDKKSLSSNLLFCICLFFTLWVLDIFTLWVAAYNDAVMFGWQITPILEVGIFIFSIYFALVITSKNREDISYKLKIPLSLLMLSVIAILPTDLNIPFYNMSNCEGVPGVFWNYMYTGEMLVIILITFLFLRRFSSCPKDDPFRNQILLFGIGIVSFLSLFTASNIVGQITQIQEISFVGSLGMVMFLAFLVYVIVKFKTFNVRLLGTQALVITQGIILGSLLFIRDINYIYVVIAISLGLFTVFGVILIRGVKREVSLREALQESNQSQTSLIHFMNHQVKGRLGFAKNVFAELLTDDYGTVPEEAKPLLQQGLEEVNLGVDYVQNILKGASAENGTLPYDMKPMDFKAEVEEVVKIQKSIAEKKGLKFNFTADSGYFGVNGDVMLLGEAIKNLIDNSINYTPEGSIDVSLSIVGKSVRLKIKDTGVGISDEDKTKLFKSGGRGAESLKVNTNSTGYGLVFVKGVVEAHKGKVWVESDGKGKGSTFYVEIPKS